MRLRASLTIASAITLSGFALSGPMLPGSGTAAAGVGSLDHQIGKALFERLWVSAPASTQSADGLGPLYVARSCATCHPAAGRGRPPPEANAAGQGAVDQGTADQRAAVPSAGLVLRLNDDPVYGRQFHTVATPGQLAEGRVTVAHRDEKVAFPDGSSALLRRPVYGTADLGYGPMAEGTGLSPRLAPSLHGLGLLERIPEADILAFEDADDRDGDGVSGRANRIEGAVGRFGWKAAHPTIEHQDAEAFSLDIGLSTPLFPAPWGDCTEVQTDCRTARHGDSPQFEGMEVPSNILAMVDGFVRGLPAPTAAPPSQDPGGSALFAAAGCAACHRPTFTIAGPAGDETIAPHTDLLLHDMGDGLADAVPAGLAGGREWRTAPLWGLAALAAGDGTLSLLHDGRARSVEEAVLWHGGEAEGSRRRYMEMPLGDRQRLLRYVLSR